MRSRPISPSAARSARPVACTSAACRWSTSGAARPEPDGNDPYGPRTLQIVASATKGARRDLRRAARGGGPSSTSMRRWPSTGRSSPRPARRACRCAICSATRRGCRPPDRRLSLDETLDWDDGVRRAGRDGAGVGARLGARLPRVHLRLAGRRGARPHHRQLAGAADRRADRAAARPRPARRPAGRPSTTGWPRCGRYPPPPPGAEPDPLTARYADPGQLAGRAFFVDAGLFAGVLHRPAHLGGRDPGRERDGHRARAGPHVRRMPRRGRRRPAASTTRCSTAATAEQCAGADLVTGYETRYALGFQLPFPYRPMAGDGSFGHYGLGGTTAFASRRHGFAIGYTPNQMGRVFPPTRARSRSSTRCWAA